MRGLSGCIPTDRPFEETLFVCPCSLVKKTSTKTSAWKGYGGFGHYCFTSNGSISSTHTRKSPAIKYIGLGGMVEWEVRWIEILVSLLGGTVGWKARWIEILVSLLCRARLYGGWWQLLLVILPVRRYFFFPFSSPHPYDFRQFLSWDTKGKRNKEWCPCEIRTWYFKIPAKIELFSPARPLDFTPRALREWK